MYINFFVVVSVIAYPLRGSGMVEGLNPGHSIFFHFGSQKDSTMEVERRKQDVWGLNEGGSGKIRYHISDRAYV